MTSSSWESITQAYQEILLDRSPSPGRRIEGMHHILSLIPLLRQSEALKAGIRYLSLYNLVFELPEKTTQMRIMPPGLISTGSSTEFEVLLNNPESNRILSQQRISCSALERVVQTAEDYFMRLKDDENIP